MYYSLDLENITNYITLLLLHDNLFLMKELTLFCHCAPEFILSNQKKNLQMSHLLQLLIVLLLLILSLGYKGDAATSYKFLLRLYIIENFLLGKTFFKTSSECR